MCDLQLDACRNTILSYVIELNNDKNLVSGYFHITKA